MDGNNGLSRARLRQALRNNAPPAPIPVDLGPAAGDSDVVFDILGMVITKDTGVVFVPDAAGPGETATVTATNVTPSTGSDLGTVNVSVSFASLPAATANLFRIFLTGPHGQREFVGTVSSV